MINSSKPPCASISDICFLFAGFSFGVKSIHLLLAKKKKKKKKKKKQKQKKKTKKKNLL